MVTLKPNRRGRDGRGPGTGLRELAAAERDPALHGNHRVDAVRAHLLEMSGDLASGPRSVPSLRLNEP